MTTWDDLLPGEDPEIERIAHDPYARADFLRDYYEDHFPCRTCGSPDPAIIEGRYCCDCTGENAEAFERTRAARLAATNA